jgi:hypothetical protein
MITVNYTLPPDKICQTATILAEKKFNVVFEERSGLFGIVCDIKHMIVNFEKMLRIKYKDVNHV